MNIGVTGIGNLQFQIGNALKKAQIEVQYYDYPETQMNEEILLVIYDGFFVNNFLSYSQNLTNRAIPIFFDNDLFTYFIGNDEKTCLDCLIRGFIEEKANVYKQLFLANNFPLIDYLLDEEIELFTAILLNSIQESENNYEYLFSLESSLTYKKVRHGYTMCKKCDKNHYDSQELLSFVQKELI